MSIKLNIENSGVEEKEIIKYKEQIEEIHTILHQKVSDPEQFLGWLELPTKYDKKEFNRIKKAASKIQKNSEVFITIGIGGSYLGARAVIESLTNSFQSLLSNSKRKTPIILYAGNNISSTYLNEILEFVLDKDFSINVISKSGTTTEPAIAFRVFRELLEQKYGISGARERIYVTTDKEKGALKKLADEQEYETFVVPDSIGGRYSVLTAVGLLPIAVAGIDIDELMKGAAFAQERYSDKELKYNACYRYAVVRNILYNKGKNIEALVNYEPRLHYMTEWWKQLYGESEGKDGKGLFPVGLDFTTDLHSMGQYVQQGKRILFETVLNVENPLSDITMKIDEDNADGLNFLAGKTVDYINHKAMEGTMKAHISGGVPNIIVNIDKICPESIGHLLYFFQKACAMSGNILGVNPFNQPGVEEYKKNMFKLLEKPGY